MVDTEFAAEMVRAVGEAMKAQGLSAVSIEGVGTFHAWPVLPEIPKSGKIDPDELKKLVDPNGDPLADPDTHGTHGLPNFKHFREE